MNLPIEIKKTRDKELVVKSNDLVQASYNLKLTQLRLWLLVLSKVSKNDKDLSSYRIYNHELKAFVGKKHKDYLRIVKRCSKELIKEVIEIPLPNGDVLQTSFLSGVKYSRQGYADFSFHEDLKPYLIDIHDNFTSYILENISKLPSSSSIRMYQITKQYENIPKIKLDIEGQLKKWLRLQGKYANTNDFIRSVIESARKDMIENECDVFFDYEPVNQGRKIVALNFYPKRSRKAPPSSKLDESTTLINSDVETYRRILKDLGLTPSQIKKHLDCEKPDLHNIAQAIELAKKRFEEGRVKNITAYLYKILEDGPQDKPKYVKDLEGEAIQEKEKIAKAKKELADKKRREEKEKRIIDTLIQEFESVRTKEQEEIVSKFTPEDWADFEEYARRLPNAKNIFKNGEINKNSSSFSLWVKVFASHYQPKYQEAFLKWALKSKGYSIKHLPKQNAYRIVGKQELLI